MSSEHNIAAIVADVTGSSNDDLYLCFPFLWWISEIYLREVLTWETLLCPKESHIDLASTEMALKILLFFPRDCQENPRIYHDTTEHGGLCSPRAV